MVRYQHTQAGYVIFAFVTLLCGFIYSLFLILPLEPGEEVLQGLVAVLLLIILMGAWIYRTLTIRVKQDTLEWSYGLGFPRHRITLAKVEQVQITELSFLAGWGERHTPNTSIYQISGRDAVELTLKSGYRILLGTNEPAELAQAIREASS